MPAPTLCAVARNKLAAAANVSFYEASLDAMPLADGSMDFGYSLGVLHHLPDPRAGLAACVSQAEARRADARLYLLRL